MSLQSLTSGYSVALKRPTTSQDSSGGPVREPFTVANGITGAACTIQPASGSAQMMAWQQRQIRLTHQVYFSTDIGPVRSGYRLETTDGTRKFIVHSYQNEAGMNRMWVADVEEQL